MNGHSLRGAFVGAAPASAELPFTDDFNVCTLDDVCGGGICGGTPAPPGGCDDGNPCTSDDSCGDGVCAGTPLCGNGRVEPVCMEACDRQYSGPSCQSLYHICRWEAAQQSCDKICRYRYNETQQDECSADPECSWSPIGGCKRRCQRILSGPLHP